MASVETLLTELDAGLRALETKPVFPDGMDLERHFRRQVRTSCPPQDFPLVLERLRAADTVDGSKRRALLAVLASSTDAQSYPWKTAVATCQADWPTWGYPFRKLAEHAFAAGELETAWENLERANLRGRIGDIKLVALLDRLCRVAHTRHDDSLERLCLERICRHRCTVSAFSHFADFARRTRQFELQDTIVRQWLSIFGQNPASWPVDDDFLDLSSAGSLCMHVNQSYARSGAPHEFEAWNHAALDFFQRGLSRATAGGDHFYVRVRISETCAQMIRFARPERMSDDDFDSLFELAQSIAVDLTDRARHSDVSTRDNLYVASRHLAAVYSGAVTRARATHATDEVIQALIEKADAHYMALAHLARGDKRHQADDLRTEFLFDNIEYGVAVRALEDAYPAPIVDAALKFRTGRVGEAIRQLTAFAADVHTSGNHLGYALLLAHYLRVAERECLSLEAQDRFRARDTLQGLVPRLVRECLRWVRKGEYWKANRCLLVLLDHSDAPSSRLVHLKARVQLGLGVHPARVAASLAPIVLDERLTNDYLRVIFLQALARTDRRLIDPAKAWQLVEKTQGAAVESGGSRQDAFSVSDVLLWELRAGYHETWPEHVVQAQRQFPNDKQWARLPARAYEIAPKRADALALAVVVAASSDARIHPWVAEVLKSVPSSFFGNCDVLRELGPVVSACLDPNGGSGVPLARVLGDQLSAALLASWLRDGDSREQVETTIAWTERWIPHSLQSHCWTQLLGASRGELEASLVQRRRQQLDSLRQAIVEPSSLSRNALIDVIETFIDDATVPTVVSRPGALHEWTERVVTHCVDGSLRYRPWSPDPTYWRELERLVSSVASSARPDISLIAHTWMTVQERIARVVDARLGPIMRTRFHRLKNELARGELRRETYQEKVAAAIARAQEFLALHRWPQLEPIDLRDVLADAVRKPPFVSARRSQTNPVAVYAIRPDVPVLVSADHALMVEVATELLRNALKAVERTGPAGWIHAEVHVSAGMAELSVCDSGGGCPGYRLRELNESWSSTSSTLASGGFGHGFCRRVVELHGGELQYEYRPERDFGLSVRVRLPVVESPSRGEES